MTAVTISCMIIGLGLIIQTHCYNFGYNNRYTCHCINDEICDTVTGGCTNGCLRGWDGPSCQRENIALDSTSVNQSAIFKSNRTKFGPQLVVDGYKSTDNTINYCSDTDYSPWAWLAIDLQQIYSIGYLKTFHRQDQTFQFKGFSVHIDDKLCFKHTGTSNPPAVFPIQCYNTIAGRYVNISNNKPGDTKNFICMCEAEIYVCSQGTYGSECNNFCYCYNNDKCDVITGKCPNGCQIGWHGDSCSNKCSTINKYGEGCHKSCDARQCSSDTTTCNHVTGECIGGCKSGYIGIGCSHDCPSGTYGDKCSKECKQRQCKGSQECHHITGKCNDGCKPGYIENDCTVACSVGKYGDGCSKQCRNRQCKRSPECHHTTGKCIDGCTAGYREDDCTVEINTIASIDREKLLLDNWRQKEEIEKLHLEQINLNLQNEILMLKKEEMANRSVSDEL